MALLPGATVVRAKKLAETLEDVENRFRDNIIGCDWSIPHLPFGGVVFDGTCVNSGIVVVAMRRG